MSTNTQVSPDTGQAGRVGPLDLLRLMLRMRRLEEQVLHFAEDHKLFRGHYHVYIGQEASGAGACSVLRRDDYLFTTHRNHAHVLAKGGDPEKVLAETIGRTGGYCGGRAGTFHVAAPEIGIPHTSAIVGGCLPLAAGTAYASKLKKSDQATIVFFGDGAMEEGAFSETLNIAQLWKLPLIFFMENNAVTPEERSGRGSPTSEHSAKALSDVPRAFSVETYVLDGTQVEAVQAKTAELVERVRRGEGPFFIEARTSRWPGSYGSFPRLMGGDSQVRWAWEPESAPAEVRTWEAQSDPVVLEARSILDRGLATQEQLIALAESAHAEIDEAAARALASPPPAPESALEYAYA